MATHREERIIYMIKPIYLLQDLTRALRKLGFEPLMSSEEGLWVLEGASRGRRVLLKLESHEEVVPGLEVLGEVPVSKLTVEAEGPGEFIKALRHRLEVELLRCLG